MQLRIRGVNYGLDDGLKDHIERRLWFARAVRGADPNRLTVLLTDVNGPRGGLDKRCRIAVALVPRGMVMVEGGTTRSPSSPAPAKRAGRAVGRELERRRRGRDPRV